MSKPACILFLLDWRPVFWSTREEFFRQLSQRLSERGIIPVLTVSEAVTDDVRRRLEETGARLVVCSYHSHPLQYWAHIRRTVRQYSVQAAHVRFFDYFTAVLWMSRLAGIRTVIFTEANSGEWKSSGVKARIVRLRTAVMCRPLSKVIAISRFIAERLTALGVRNRITSVVYNGIDLSAFRPDRGAREDTRRQIGADSGTVVLCFASVLLPWKRPEIAVRVCAELHRRGKDVRLLMAGDGPQRQPLERQAQELNVAAQVCWLGYQSDLPRWFAGADVFLHTALGEAFGNVLVEAMACGLPVVATRSGAAPELVVEGESGFLVSAGPKEVEELADAVQRITGDPDRYKAMAVSAVKQAGTFSLERCVTGTLAVYDELIPYHSAGDSGR